MKQVLLIEDDFWIKDCYLDWLRSNDFKVVWAPDAQQALDLVTENYALIILDMFLPHSNGVQFLNTLASHADLSKIPVVVLSTMPPNKDLLANYGVVDVINKTTVTKSELLQVVKSAIL